MRTIWIFAVVTLAAHSNPAQKNFVTCPIIRDTKTVPCWLAEYDGETYFLGIQEDLAAKFHPPQLQHKALIEGSVSPGPRVCGGIVLKPVTVSVLPDVDRSCNTMLPAQDGLEAPTAFRGPGPSYKQINPIPRAPTTLPKPPFAPREFTIYYSFDSTYLPGPMTSILEEAVHFAKSIHASRIEVAACRGKSHLSNGQDFIENPNIAETRAKQIGEILRTVGIPAPSIEVNWKSFPQPADGIHDPLTRRATLLVKP